MCAISLEPSHRSAILLIEDDVELRDVINIALTQNGYEVATVSNGRDALHHLRSTSSTWLIILDLTLPQMNGEEFRRAQLHDRSFAWIPVLVLSGRLDGLRKTRELDARAFVPKPVDLDVLLDAVRRISCTSSAFLPHETTRRPVDCDDTAEVRRGPQSLRRHSDVARQNDQESPGEDEI
jgi:two-component system chemotaxis response regulator CheY